METLIATQQNQADRGSPGKSTSFWSADTQTLSSVCYRFLKHSQVRVNWVSRDQSLSKPMMKVLKKNI